MIVTRKGRRCRIDNISVKACYILAWMASQPDGVTSVDDIEVAHWGRRLNDPASIHRFMHILGWRGFVQRGEGAHDRCRVTAAGARFLTELYAHDTAWFRGIPIVWRRRILKLRPRTVTFCENALAKKELPPEQER